LKYAAAHPDLFRKVVENFPEKLSLALEHPGFMDDLADFPSVAVTIPEELLPSNFDADMVDFFGARGLACVAEERRTEDLCRNALAEGGVAVLDLVPESSRSAALCGEVVALYPDRLADVPEALVTDEFLTEFVARRRPEALRSFPAERLTESVFVAAREGLDVSGALDGMPVRSDESFSRFFDSGYALHTRRHILWRVLSADDHDQLRLDVSMAYPFFRLFQGVFAGSSGLGDEGPSCFAFRCVEGWRSRSDRIGGVVGPSPRVVASWSRLLFQLFGLSRRLVFSTI
jgi:hypothetical protein